MTNLYIENLEPKSSRKSFWGKAIVVVDDHGIETLFSYEVPIIKRYSDGRLRRLYDGWTYTTGAHILAFCGLNKAEFLALPLNEKV